MKLSSSMQMITSVILLWSFIEAFHFGRESALDLWKNGWEGIATVFAFGVLGKTATQTIERVAESKYRSRPAGLAEGEEP